MYLLSSSMAPLLLSPFVNAPLHHLHLPICTHRPYWDMKYPCRGVSVRLAEISVHICSGALLGVGMEKLRLVGMRPTLFGIVHTVRYGTNTHSLEKVRELTCPSLIIIERNRAGGVQTLMDI